MRKIDDNPFSFESYLLRDAQRIVAEICERREHKIANSAVMNVQRAYQLFKESKSKDSKDDNQITVPINSTPEEEGLYLELVDSLIKYRGSLTAPLMSYIQKNQGNHGKKPVDKSKVDKSLKSINIDELLSDAQTESLVDRNIKMLNLLKMILRTRYLKDLDLNLQEGINLKMKPKKLKMRKMEL